MTRIRARAGRRRGVSAACPLGFIVLFNLFVVLRERLLDVLVVRLHHLERLPYALQTQVAVRLRGAVDVFVLAVALNLLAPVADLDQAERRRGALEEVAE